jgi:GNAT superfamily N-acetyltransferase
MEIKKDSYLITDDKNIINYDFVVNLLQNTYWAKIRDKDIIIKSINNSIFISLFKGNEQIGFTRIVTDSSLFAWIADVYLTEEYRGKGLGRWLVKITIEHPSIKDVSLQLLKTKDAHELYNKLGFKKDECMVKRI